MYSLISKISREVVGPLAARVGTAIAFYLAGYVGGDVANNIGLAVGGLLLVGWDLLVARVRREKIEKAAYREGSNGVVGPNADDLVLNRKER